MADNSPHHLTMIVRNICGCDVDDLDGIIYDLNSIVSEVMQSQREYEGIRIYFQAQLESAKIPMQIDVGFGDIVTPAPEQITYPTLLDLPAPSLRGYPAETVIAEKLHAMVEKGMLNSRLKDYHDIWLLLRQGCWKKKVVEQALERTFKQRGTNFMRAQLFQVIEHYGSAADRQLLWKRYCRKGKYEIVPQNLEQVCSDILRVLQN